MKNNKDKELQDFNTAMDKLLKVPPQVVKAAMEAEKKAREQERKAKKADKDK
jgi:hypothetical protein